MPRLNSAAQLRGWLAKRRISQREGAALLQLDATYLNAILSNRRRPGLPLAVRLEKQTGVPANSWISPKDAMLATEGRMKARAAGRLKRAQATMAASSGASESTTDESASPEQVTP